MYQFALLTDETFARTATLLKANFMRAFMFLLLACTGTALHAQTVTLTSNNNPVCSGSAVTFTATVNPGTGTVDFFDGATPLGTVNIGAGGTASFTTSALTGGGHSITAVYST